MNDDPPLLVIEGEGFSIHLGTYDGPLDLLLQLIRKEELDIFDIPIARLTTAYLAALDAMRRMLIEPASEFLVMAATLMQIKSRLLLPRPTALDDALPEDEDDPRAELVRRLLEYQRFQQAAAALAQRPWIGRDVFLRAPGLDRPPDEDEEDDAARYDLFRLAEAFRRVIARGHYEPPHEIYVERISIAERIAQIASRLATSGRLTFTALCEDARHREEVVTTFLALLEMSRLKLIKTVQRERLGPLYLESRVEAIDERGEEASGMLD